MFYLDRRRVERFKDRQRSTDSAFKLNLKALCPSFCCELTECFLSTTETCWGFSWIYVGTERRRDTWDAAALMQNRCRMNPNNMKHFQSSKLVYLGDGVTLHQSLRYTFSTVILLVLGFPVQKLLFCSNSSNKLRKSVVVSMSGENQKLNTRQQKRQRRND